MRRKIHIFSEQNLHRSKCDNNNTGSGTHFYFRNFVGYKSEIEFQNIICEDSRQFIQLYLTLTSNQSYR